MKQIPILFMAFSALTACQKDVALDNSSVGIYSNCHNRNQWSERQIFDSLAGSWLRKGIECADNRAIKISGTFSVQFQKDSSLIVFDKGIEEARTRFKLRQEDRTEFAVVQDSFVAPISGRIFFCDGKVVFNDSYVDGCDNYFVRLK